MRPPHARTRRTVCNVGAAGCVCLLPLATALEASRARGTGSKRMDEPHALDMQFAESLSAPRLRPD